ncbi:hypothetical protein EDB83DRAFT_2315685 [Lactarius deliciosus]|nr:hypothetical protein EDB83DRAFT_2315685 [Lactarius deliciosus]
MSRRGWYRGGLVHRGGMTSGFSHSGVVKENSRVANDGGGSHRLTWQGGGSDDVALRRGVGGNHGDVGEYRGLVGKYPGNFAGNDKSRGGKCDRNEYQMSVVDV